MIYRAARTPRLRTPGGKGVAPHTEQRGPPGSSEDAKGKRLQKPKEAEPSMDPPELPVQLRPTGAGQEED